MTPNPSRDPHDVASLFLCNAYSESGQPSSVHETISADLQKSRRSVCSPCIECTLSFETTPFIFRGEAPSLHKKMACLPTTKKTRHQSHSCWRNHQSQQLYQATIYPKGCTLNRKGLTPCTLNRKGANTAPEGLWRGGMRVRGFSYTVKLSTPHTLNRKGAYKLPRRVNVAGETPLHP